MHKRRKLSLARVMRAVERDDMTGFCVNCGAERGNVEPDAKNYPCEKCGEPAVMGAEEVLARIAG